MVARKPIPQEALDYYLAERPKRTWASMVQDMRERWPDRFGHLAGGSILKVIREECGRRGVDPVVGSHTNQWKRGDYKIPEAVSLPPQLEDCELPYQDCLVLSDVHIPNHDPVLMARALEEAQRRKLKLCILNGDIYDNEWASSYIKFGKTPAVQEQLEPVAQLFVALLEAGFETVVFVTGNHEDRIERLTGGALSTMGLIGMTLDVAPPKLYRKLKDLVRVTPNYWCRLTDTPDGIPWEFHHQFNYRQKRLSTAMDLALKVTNCHTATGHEHHWGVTISDNGKWLCVNLPCMEDDARTGYKQRRKRVAAQWVKGYCVLLDGVPQLRTDLYPDQWWERLFADLPRPKKRRVKK